MPTQKLDKDAQINIFPSFMPIRVKYKDVFDLKAFYEAMHEWMLENNWKDKEDKLDHWESYYGDRTNQQGMKEIWMLWRVTKEPDDAKIQYYMDIEMHCLGITTTEMVVKGQKIKLNKGEIELKINSIVEKKYVAEWKKHWLLKHLLDLFTNRIYSDAIDMRKKELYQESYALQNYIKQWFKLKRYLPYEENKDFFTSVAYPSHMKE